MIVIDRFEGENAVCESAEEMLKIARSSLPEQVAEGDVLVQAADGSFVIDSQETARRRERAASRLRTLTLRRLGQ